MGRRLFLLSTTAIALNAPSITLAEPSPPKGSKSPSEILRPIEARSNFGYFEVEGNIDSLQRRTLVRRMAAR
jgi:hypothetical protein